MVTMIQVEDIAKTKMPDLNAESLDSAVKIILGTARSMGVEVGDHSGPIEADDQDVGDSVTDEGVADGP